MAPVTHIVLFQFKSDAAAEDIKKVSEAKSQARTALQQDWRINATPFSQQLNSEMLALKDNCVHPTTKQPYIKSAKGGIDNSIEGRQDGITHAFVVEFANEEDRQYYVEKDPAHLGFIQNVIPHAVKAQVIDFTPGVF